MFSSVNILEVITLFTLRGLSQADSMTDFKLAGQETRPRSLFPGTGQVQASQLLEKPQACVKGTPPQLIKGQLAKLVAKRPRATLPWHEARIVSLGHSITQIPRERTHQSRYRSPTPPYCSSSGFKTESANSVRVLASRWNWAPACKNLFNKHSLLLHTFNSQAIIQ